MRVKMMRTVLLFGPVFLASCSAQPTQAPAEDSEPRAGYVAGSPLEKALIDQITCTRPAQAAVTISALLRQGAVAETNDGGDGIAFFVPTRPISLFGFEVVRLGGWQPSSEGSGAMEPFTRGPGTAPPTFISVAIRAPIDAVRSKLKAAGIKEAYYIPDSSSSAFTDSDGQVRQPRRLVPGAELEEGDNPDSHIENPITGVTTITCSASEMDFQKEIEAQFAHQ